MKLSVRGEYALRALLVLALHYGEGVVSIESVSRQQNIPKKFLEQILNDLKSMGAVESRRGAAGGYRLARPPQNITLASVVRHVEGALAPVSCVSDRFYERCTCPDEATCPIREVMKEVREAVAQIMEKVTLRDLCERSARLEQMPASMLDFAI
jgi:Rrf2 family transcriptional regulator, cysteine metabolism repressor